MNIVNLLVEGINLLGNKIKHTQRYQEILNCFIKNGFSHILFRIGLTDRLTKIESTDTKGSMNLQDVGIKLRHSLQQLGPTFSEPPPPNQGFGRGF